MTKQYPDWLPDAIGFYKPAAYLAEFERFADELAMLRANSNQARQRILNEFPELSEAQASELLGFIVIKKNEQKS